MEMRRDGSVRHWRRLLAPLAPMSIAVLALWGFPALAPAAGCPNEAVRTAELYGLALPDCRAYERVSPVDKNTTDASGTPDQVQASPSGGSVSYYSIVPFPGLSAASEFPTYLSTRGSSDWTTQGLLAPTFPNGGSNFLGLTEDDDYAIEFVSDEGGPLLAPGAEAERDNFYVHNNITGEYQLLASRANLVFADATPDDSHILFTETRFELVPGVVDEEEVPYLYEWDRETGEITFVGVVGGKAPRQGTVPGSNEGEFSNHYNQNTISTDGSRIFFSEAGEAQRVYMREPAANRTVEISPGAAQWRAATPDGGLVFYTEDGQLYRFNVDKFEASKKPEPEALTEAREVIAGAGAEVLGLAGASTDGSYAYFVAKGVLSGENESSATSGVPNLYEWHPGNGATGIRFIATLSEFYDSQDWAGARTYSGNGKGSRITADGLKLLFAARARVGEYDNAGHNEIYLYDATKPVSANNPACLSCSYTVAAALSDATLEGDTGGSSPTPPSAHMTRNLSEDGAQVFFQTQEALVPQDANGVMDVYEWEQGGTGSCAVGEADRNGGCIYLISSGQSSDPSVFGEASEGGGDVFFFTRQSLVSQDRDNNIDLYDARVDGGLASQNEPSTSQCEGEECRGAATISPVLAAPSSVTLSGTGNLVSRVEELKPKVKPPTRAQKLVAALKACRRRPKSKRAHCRSQAQKMYGAKAKKSGDRRGN